MGDPEMYLGAKLKEHETANGIWCWTMSPSKYVREAVKNCDAHLKKNFDGRHSLPKKAPNPFLYRYEAKSDTSPALDPERASYYQSIIGVMRWMVELG